MAATLCHSIDQSITLRKIQYLMNFINRTAHHFRKIGIPPFKFYSMLMTTLNKNVAPSKNSALSIKYKKTCILVPDLRNARTHSRKQILQIVASIREFGFTNPILTDPESRLIAGHGRLLAAKEMGLDQVPVIEIPGLSDVQKRALRLADN